MNDSRSDRLWLPTIATVVLTLLFAWQALSTRESPLVWFALPVAAILFFLYMAAGWTTGVDYFAAWVQESPGRVYVLPLLLWAISLLYGMLAGRLSLEVAAFGLAFLLIPVELARREATPWRPRDLLLGWVALAIPLMTPLAGKQSFVLEVSLRVGAFLLPALFVLLARGRWTGIRLLLGIFYVWYSIEFGEYPRLNFPVVSLYHLYAFVIVLYALLVAGQLPAVGFGLSVNAKELVVAGREFLFFLPIALIIGIATGFLEPHWGLPPVGEMVAKAIAIFVFTGVPEELLFRGIIHRFVADYIPNPLHALGISSLIFGAAHLNNPPMVGIYFILATIAGWFYGRTYVATGRITPAALVHTAVDWVWGMVL